MNLKYIEVENFKSYQGKHVIGPFESFTCVIGPNGCGKSNLLDSLSFVFGDKISNLRVKSTNELVYGASIGNEKETDFSGVTAIFMDNEANSKKFCRKIASTNGCEYYVDGQKTTKKEYHQILRDLGIDIKSRNFLVPQGSIESIATKTPKERCKMFEHISGSEELVEEYEKLKNQLEEAMTDTSLCFNKKKGVLMELRQAKIEKDEADKYSELQCSISENRMKLSHLRFWLLDQSIGELREKIENLQNEKQKIVDQLNNNSQLKLKELKSQYMLHSKETNQLSKKKTEKEQELIELRPLIMNLKKNKMHLVNKIKDIQKQIESLSEKSIKHSEEIESLNKSLQESNKKLEEAKQARIANKTQLSSSRVGFISEDSSLTIETEYRFLKENVKNKFKDLLTRLNGYEEEKQSRLEKSQLLLSQKESLQRQFEEIKSVQRETEERFRKVQEFIKVKQQELESKKSSLQEISQKIISNTKMRSDLLAELEKITHQLSEAQSDHSLSSRRVKQQELIVEMKTKFPRLIGTLSKLCQPVHKRYKISLTKVMGKHMDSMVVEDVETCKLCISYMKELRAEPMTFIPLDSVETKSLNESYRLLGGTSKLLFDCVTFSDSRIEKAVLFSLGNAIVCDTSEEARNLAFNCGERKRVVSLDGTMFQKSGVISGGVCEVLQRSKQWDEKSLDNLQTRRTSIQKNIDELPSDSHLLSESQSYSNEITSCENHLKYSQRDHLLLKKKLQEQTNEVSEIQAKLDEISNQTSNMEDYDRELERNLDETKSEYCKLEDQEFSEFCQKYKFMDIREYETTQTEILTHSIESDKEISNLSKIINQLQRHLEYETSKDPSVQISRLEELRNTFNIELEEIVKNEESHVKNLKSTEEQFAQFEIERSSLKLKCEDLSKLMKKESENVKKTNEKVTLLQHEINSTISDYNEKMDDRTGMYQTCQIQNIEINLLDIEPTFDMNEDILSQAAGIKSQNGNITENNISVCELKQKPCNFTVNYSVYEEEFSRIRDPSIQGQRLLRELEKKLDDFNASLSSIKSPNLKAAEKLEEIGRRMDEINDEFTKRKELVKSLRIDFESVKKERTQRFMKAFDTISSNIDQIYKALSSSASAQAFLTAENAEEPYLAGINFSCIAPGKRYRLMDSMSGGEKTMAALALIFAIHRHQPSPLFILDEVDAALDNTNINKLTQYLLSNSEENINSLVVSLKDEFYHTADSLIGITCEPNRKVTTTRVFTFNLKDASIDRN